MIITALKQKGNNVIVYFDEGESIYLDYRTVTDFGLRKNDSIDETVRSKLISDSNFHKANDSAFRILSGRQHSVHELRTKLTQKKLDEETIDKVVDTLITACFLDDAKFANAYIDERVRKRVGINRIRAELFKKGVSREIINSALEHLDSQFVFKQAEELARKKLDSLKKRESDIRKIKSKLFSFLTSRGYESDVVVKLINELVQEDVQQENLN